jgi:hypothetical protein
VREQMVRHRTACQGVSRHVHVIRSTPTSTKI